MMTRKASARQEESKLQLALQELKIAREKCDQLISERDDHERELLIILNKNKMLKNELVTLHSQYVSVNEQRDSLQITVDSFSKCYVEYEDALRKISLLEDQLREAQLHITMLEAINQDSEAQKTQSLFDELVNSNPALVSAASCSNNLSIVDLTGDDTINSPSALSALGCSRNKLKKYVKIKRFIKKTQKLLRRQKYINKNLKNKGHLLEKMHQCTIESENSRTKFEADVNLLNNKIAELESSLQIMTCMYEDSQRLVEEHSQAVTNILELNKETAERFYSLQNNLNVCDCQLLSVSRSESETSPLSPCELTSPPSSVYNGLTTNNDVKINSSQNKNQNNTNKINQNVIMFSDNIGKDMGQLLSSKLGRPVLNNCMPMASYKDIMQKVSNYYFSSDTTLILFINNRHNLKKKELIQYFDMLYLLKVKQIIMFTIPYNDSLPAEENNIRYKLNMCMHTMCTNNNMHLIDTNIFVRKKLCKTGNKYYLPLFIKRQIAESLSFYIDISAKNLANNYAPIEHCRFKVLTSYNAPIEQSSCKTITCDNVPIGQTSCKTMTSNHLN